MSESPVALRTIPVDVIIAFDGSASMVQYLCNVLSSLTSFIDGLGPEMRVVTLYDLATFPSGCGSGDPFPSTEIAQDALRYRHFTVDIDSFNAFDELVAQHVNYGSFLRPGAATHIVVVTDDNDDAVGTAAPFMSQMQTLLGHTFVFDAMVADGQNGCLGAAVGSEFLALADLTAGAKVPICTTPPSASAAALQASVEASHTSSCGLGEVSIPARELVQLFFQPSAGNKGELPRAADGGADCAADLGWYYQDTGVVLCPAACTLVKQGGQLSLGNGCPPVRL